MKIIKRTLIYAYTRFFMLIFLSQKIQNNKIVITNMYGKGYGDNGKNICKELKARNRSYDIVWLVKKHYDDMPKNIRQVRIGSIKALYEQATAKIWIDNHRKETGVIKRKKQTYIQTWHSSLRLKQIEKEVEKDLPSYYVRKAKHDSKMIDILTCGSDFSKKTYEKSFWYNGQIVMTGSPRYDDYFTPLSNFETKQVESKFNTRNSKTILYAPTFRKNDPEFCGKLNYEQLNDRLKNNGITLLVRLHPGSNAKIKEYSNIKNATDYPSLQNLIKYCSLIITDYSGLCFDSLIMKKPCILYVPDLENYLSTERNLCFKVDELPFAKIKQPEELEKIILKNTYAEYIKQYEQFIKRVGLMEDGQSSKRLCDIIERIIEKDDQI